MLGTHEQFYNETIKSLGIDTKTALQLGVVKDLHNGKNPSIVFKYKDLIGNFIDYEVHRLLTPQKNPQTKKEIKYTNPHGKTTKYYFNGIIDLKPNFDKTIYFTEGQKKSIALCKNGLFTVGNQGITVLHTTEKDNDKQVIGRHPKSEYLELISNYDNNNNCFIIDTDFRTHKANVERLNVFFAAIINFKNISNKTNKEPFLACLTDLCGVKAFDDIKDTEIKESVLNGLKMLKSNKYIHVWRLNDFSEENIRYIVNGRFSFNQYFLEGKYLSNDKELTNLIRERIVNTNNSLLIRAATGKGKTQYIIDLIHTIIGCNRDLGDKQKICLVFPTNSLLESLESRIKEKANCFIFNQHTESIEKKYLSQNIDSHDVILTTYASYNKISFCFNDNDIVFYDEFHYAMSALCNKDFKGAFIATTAKKVMISATPIIEFNYCQKIEMVYISDYEIKPKYKLNSYYYTAKTFPLVSNYIDNLTKEKNDLHVVFYNNVENIEKLESIYEKHYEIHKFYSSDNVRGCENYQNFLKNGLITKNTNKPLLVLATKFIYEGVSFVNKNVSSIAIVNENSPIDTIQALNRFRNIDNNTSINVFLKSEIAYKNKCFNHSFEKVFRVANSLSQIRMGRFSDIPKTIKSDYDKLILNNTYLDYFTEGGDVCDFSLSNLQVKFYSMIDYLANEFDVLSPVPYEFSEYKTPEQNEKLDNDKIALSLLNENKQLAASIVLSNLDYVNNKDFYSYLKTSFGAENNKSLQAKRDLFSYLFDYFNLVFKIHSINIDLRFDDYFLWANKSKRKSYKLIQQLKTKEVVRLQLQKTPVITSNVKGKENVVIVMNIYDLVLNNCLGKSYKSQKEFYFDVYSQYTNLREKEQLNAKINTKFDTIKLIIDTCFTIELREKKNGCRTYIVGQKM